MNSRVSEGQRYICSKPHCRSEIEVPEAPGSGGGTNPLCACGSPTKKPYQKPVLTKLIPSEARERLGKASPR
jgi:hypothetical protein